MSSLRVVIDGCQGHAQCISYCPQVFALDDDGYAFAMQPVVPEEAEHDARAAEAGCPERAIRLVDDAPTSASKRR